MAYGIGHGYGPALGYSQQRQSVPPCRLHDRLQILDPEVKRHLRDVPLGKAIASFVVADQAVMFGQLGEPMLPDGAVPFVGQPDAVTSGAELDFLPWRRP